MKLLKTDEYLELLEKVRLFVLGYKYLTQFPKYLTYDQIIECIRNKNLTEHQIIIFHLYQKI